MNKFAEEIYARYDELESERKNLHNKKIELHKEFQRLREESAANNAEHLQIEIEKRKFENIEIQLIKREEVLTMREDLRKEAKKFEPQ